MSNCATFMSHLLDLPESYCSPRYWCNKNDVDLKILSMKVEFKRILLFRLNLIHVMHPELSKRHVILDNHVSFPNLTHFYEFQKRRDGEPSFSKHGMQP